MKANPGLKSREAKIAGDAWRLARRQACTETDLDLDLFPVEPPFTIDEARNEAWLPE